jgi:hypothetical protein
MIRQITDTLYVNVCQGLFESHKIIYSFLITAAIQKNHCLISEEEFNLLFSDATTIDRTKQLAFANQQSLQGFITPQQWDYAYSMQELVPDHFSTLTQSLLLNKEKWKVFMLADSSEVLQSVPAPYSSVPRFM